MRKAGRMNLQVMEEECLRIIENADARLEMNVTGKHYLLSSGAHSESFFNMARVFERYAWRNFFAQFLLRRMRAEGIDEHTNPDCRIDVLVGPATGAMPLLYSLQGLPELENTRVIYAERDKSGRFAFAKGFEVLDNERVFIVDDVGTTFKSLKAVKILLDKFNPVYVGFGVLIDRSSEGSTHALSKWLGEHPVISGMRIPLVKYDNEEECPHCKNRVELIRV
ncbi:MAG: hypothetical protein HYT37_01010 [Candidatus Sungbacteria bacterium]|nr:hypothetical protein [Candidatus Sungbacteria bacterium]